MTRPADMTLPQAQAEVALAQHAVALEDAIEERGQAEGVD